MALSGSERVRKYRENSENVRLDMIVSAEVKRQFTELRYRYRLTNGALLQRLIDAAEPGRLISDGVDADYFLQQASGDRSQALKLLRDWANEKCPGCTSRKETDDAEKTHWRTWYNSQRKTIDRRTKQKSARKVRHT